jgi:LysM repeat protein
MMKKLFVIAVGLALYAPATAQTLTPEQYIEKYKDLAVKEMKRMGVPAAITLAQGLLETESGNSDLLRKSNNHFGIKCKSTWSGEGVSHDDDESGECFRTYKTADESYRDHSNFLRGNQRYLFLFDLDPADYKGWAYGLKKAGYATNPKYPAILIKHIEQYNLQQYTLLAINDVPKYDKSKFEDDKEVAFVYNDSEETKPIVKAVSNKEEPVVIDGNDRIGYINKVKCVMATRGTSLLAIATRQDIALAKLLQYNDLTEDGILSKDQPVFLEKKATEASTNFYISKKGESLLDVAQQNGIQLESLASYNHLTKNTVISTGSKLYLQPARQNIAVQQNNNPVASNTVATATPVKYHAVQAKEGLYGIAKKYGVTVQQLKEWNNLTSDNLSIGQQLIVSK